MNDVAAQIVGRYEDRTEGSRAAYERARASMPGGDTRSVTFFRPHPLTMARGRGARATDVDGTEYLDVANCMSAMIHGHAHPVIRAAVADQLARGSAFASPTELPARLAEILIERLPSVASVRFTNSGTEATLLALRAARAWTGRDAIVVMRGGYHGSHGAFLSEGTAGANDPLVYEIEAGDGSQAEELFARAGGRIAGVIVEPMLGAGGLIPLDPGYLRTLRAITHDHGSLLIFDEVITFRMGYGGVQGLLRIEPDLTTVGKFIGGGAPIGALGGRRDVMSVFDPGAGRIAHSGTFNANPISMASGIAAMQLLDADAITRLNDLGDRFAAGVARIATEEQVPLVPVGMGSVRGLRLADRVPASYADAERLGDGPLRELLSLALILAGVFIVPRCMVALSTPMEPADVDGALASLRTAVRMMRPALEHDRATATEGVL